MLTKSQQHAAEAQSLANSLVEGITCMDCLRHIEGTQGVSTGIGLCDPCYTNRSQHEREIREAHQLTILATTPAIRAVCSCKWLFVSSTLPEESEADRIKQANEAFESHIQKVLT